MGYFVGVYWWQREEPVEACATRLAGFMMALAEADNALAQWFKQSMSAKASLVPFPRDASGLQPFLKRNHRDIPRQVIPELGFGFSAWNGYGHGLTSSIMMTCGAYSNWVSNSVVVSFDPDATPSHELLRLILTAAVNAFEPEVGVVSSDERMTSEPSKPVWEAPAFVRYKKGSGYSTT